jgi:hypothetical protein
MGVDPRGRGLYLSGILRDPKLIARRYVTTERFGKRTTQKNGRNDKSDKHGNSRRSACNRPQINKQNPQSSSISECQYGKKDNGLIIKNREVLPILKQQPRNNR